MLFLLLSFSFPVLAQGRSEASSSIRSVKLHRTGDQTSFPALTLNGGETLQLDFDDLDAKVKNYYYTFQLCNADWTPTLLHPFEYIKGFQNVRINTYRNSSLALTRYIHYQATVPDRNCYPSRTGNYLLKVFLDGDTSKLAFTRRFIVTGNDATVGAAVQQPFNSRFFRTYQKLALSVQLDNRLRVLGPSDVKVMILQNNNWQTAMQMDRPTINRGNYFEYSDEAFTAMPGMREFRWLDLRSLRLLSDRVDRMKVIGDTAHIWAKVDPSRSNMPYLFYNDINGSYIVETLEGVNPFWQGDYALVHFAFEPPGKRPIPGQDVYIFGEMNNYASDASARMEFNDSTGRYEKSLFLKQGYYNYAYFTRPIDKAALPDFSQTEGDFWGTENNYLILVYYRPFGARADELIGSARVGAVFQTR